MASHQAAVYMSAWIAACAVAVAIAVRRRRDLELLRARYWRWLLQPWKAGTFLVAASALTLMAPYGGDLTWDYVDSVFMSVLAFIALAAWLLVPLVA